MTAETVSNVGKSVKTKAQTLNATRKYEPYPKYKDSGVEWLGKIPIKWEIRSLKSLATIEAGQSPPSDTVSDGLQELPFLQGNGEFGNVNPIPKFSCDVARKKSQKGDVLLSVRAPVGAINMSNKEYGIGRGLCAIHALNELEEKFMFYQLLSTTHQLHQVSTGSTYDAVSTGEVGRLKVIVPPLDEQKNIISHLNLEMEKIDALVAKKERLTELLKERRTALITRAVTKGLNPKASMRDSGIEWLGKIPSHWGTRRLKTLCTQHAIYGANVPASRYVNSGVRFIRTTDIDEGDLRERGVFIAESDARNYILTDGDLLISRSGTIGRTLLYNSEIHGPCTYAGYLVRFVFSSTMLPKYAFLFTKTIPFSGFLKTTAISSTIENLNGAKFSNATFPHPPIAEQISIIDFLDYETAKIDALTTKTNEAINKLKEFRTSLISAAVTGKINVQSSVA